MPLRVTTLIQRILNGKEEHAMKKYYVMLLMAVALVACSKEQEVADPKETPSVEENLVPMQFTASLEDAGTKTDLNTSTGAVSWTDSDEVAFYWEVNRKDDGTKNISSATSTSTEIDGSNANFTVAVPDDFSLSDSDFTARYSAVDPSSNVSRHMYAVYPATTTVDYSSGSSLFITIPATQDGTFANASIAVAKWSAPGENLVFNNLCGLVQVVVEDAAVRKIELSSSAEIAGKLSVTFPKEGDNLGKPVEKAISEGVNTITVNVSGAGTYYIAVRPVDITDLYVALYDSSDDLIGDKMSGNTLTVARKQIRKLGTIATGFSDRYYVKVDGTGDGSSWDNAASLTSLKTAVTNSTKNIYVAAGTYSFTSNFATNNDAAAFKIYGGYPADASGMGVGGRDISTHETIFDGGENYRLWVITKGTPTIDGITFQNAARLSSGSSDRGSALVIEGATSVTVNNCTFKNNKNEKLGGGAVRASGNTTVVMKGCIFTGNNASEGYGGALTALNSVNLTLDNCTFTDNSSNSTGGALMVESGGTVTAKNCTFGVSGHPNTSTTQGGAVRVEGALTATNCIFSYNVATTQGGAVHVNGGTFTASDCDFISNSSTSHGGAIESANAATIRMNRCVLTDNVSTSDAAADLYIGGTTSIYLNSCVLGQTADGTTIATKSPQRILTGSNTTFGMNNCVVSGAFGKSNSQTQLGGKAVVVNSTFYGQVGGSNIIAGASDADGCRVINSIILNGSSGKTSFTANSSKYIQAYNTIYSVNGTSDGSFTATDCVSDKYYGIFPDNSAWAQKYLGADATLPNGNAIKVYGWDGVCAGFTKTSLASIKTLISGTTTVGSDFLTWLESNDLKVNGVEALAVDIRGNARNTSAMWPGSYEQTSGVASAPAFSVK